MSAKITVPPEYRAYEFAKYELEGGPEVKRLKLTSLNWNAKNPGAFIAIFHRPDHQNILMVYRPEEAEVDKRTFYYLTNYYELISKNADMVKLMENNGFAYYRQRLAEDEQRKSQKGYVCDPAILASQGIRDDWADDGLEIVPN